MEDVPNTSTDDVVKPQQFDEYEREQEIRQTLAQMRGGTAGYEEKIEYLVALVLFAEGGDYRAMQQKLASAEWERDVAKATAAMKREQEK